ncbi:MAG TPA: ABC transporter ATP-binding protein [Acidothermaceae bacterium]|nr:ABC transporter ATP-binding protein [Acidothermaceae bacterium]
MTTVGIEDRLDAPAVEPVLRRGFRLLGSGIREERKVFLLAAVSSGTYGLMTVASSWVLGQVTSKVILPSINNGHAKTGALVAAVAAIVAVAVVKAAGIVGRRVGATVMQANLQASYRRRVTRSYLRLPMEWHQRHPTGELLSNANADVTTMWDFVSPLPFSVGVLVMVVVAAIAMLVVDPVIALVGGLVFPAVALLNYLYQRTMGPVANRAQQLRADVSRVAHESFDGALVVKTLGREDDETRRFAENAWQLRDANVEVGRRRGFFDPVVDALPNLGLLAVLVVGAHRVGSGAMSTGQLVEVAYLFTLLAFPIRAIGWVLGGMAESVVGGERVSRVLRATGALQYGDDQLPDDGAAHVELRSVDFAYGDSTVLADVTFPVAAGRTIAVVGPTGAGKSTLTMLLVRLVDPRSGQVFLDGVDMRDTARGEVAASVAIVPQQTFLFEDTVRGNVTLGADIPDAQVWAALDLAQADRFVRALPDGLDTRVGERGATLSGGQRQRVALARALVRRPRLLILDDATSSVDPRVEERILKGLRDAALPSTVVVVAHRSATIRLADEIVYVEQGSVVDRGRHDDVVARCDGYRALVTAYEQQEGESDAAEDDEPDDVEAPR